MLALRSGLVTSNMIGSCRFFSVSSLNAKLTELTVAKAKSAEKEHTQQHHYNKAKYQNHHELIRTASIRGITVVGHRQVIRSRENEHRS
jgi:dihydrodipicolinate reductase